MVYGIVCTKPPTSIESIFTWIDKTQKFHLHISMLWEGENVVLCDIDDKMHNIVSVGLVVFWVLSAIELSICQKKNDEMHMV